MIPAPTTQAMFVASKLVGTPSGPLALPIVLVIYYYKVLAYSDPLVVILTRHEYAFGTTSYIHSLGECHSGFRTGDITLQHWWWVYTSGRMGSRALHGPALNSPPMTFRMNILG